jgi:hypothetical protein
LITGKPCAALIVRLVAEQATLWLGGSTYQSYQHADVIRMLMTLQSRQS